MVLAAGMARRYGGLKPLAPAGPHGEAVIDLLASDALAAGFGHLVLVIHPESGPAIRYHVARNWPSSISVSFAEQRLPLGTVHAVLAARAEVGKDQPFAVANADDVYGQSGMGLLASRLGDDQREHALVGYHLASTIVTDAPVTRGVCRVDDAGRLTAIDERRQVSRLPDGASFLAQDGVLPDKLSGEELVSVNLWGFRESIWDVFDAAMEASGLDEDALLAEVASGKEIPKTEVLLPEVIGTMIASGQGWPVRVLATDSSCIGVTHAEDLPVVRAELSRQVAWGTRADRLWKGIA
ncbi:MAG TPA: sugar phosphate nucleotidyltransferase [Acidimicrobiales bacterium]|nr:sugar phosphate nucleotidyltransferase [Acidimicrobiales bacterium]